MNRIGELKKSVPGILLILCLILPFFVRNTKADNGPKPSITIRVKNAPQDYFIALSGGGSDSRDRNEKIKLKEANPGEKESKAIDLLFTLQVERNHLHIWVHGPEEFSCDPCYAGRRGLHQ